MEFLKVKENDTKVVFPLKTISPSTISRDLEIVKGSRLVVSIFVKTMAPDSAIMLKVFDRFSDSVDPVQILLIPCDSVGPVKKTLIDFHSFVTFEAEILTGDVEFSVGVSVYQNMSRDALFDTETRSPFVVAPSGVIETGELIRLIGGNFESGPLPDVTWLTNNVGSGSGAVVNGELVLSTGAVADSIAEVQTANRAEFVTATFNKAHLAIQMEDVNAPDVIREFGVFDPIQPAGLSTIQDGVLFRNNSGVISLVRQRGGSDVEEIFENNFNGNVAFRKSEIVSVFELVYNAGVILFFQNRRLVHTMRSLLSVAYDTVHLAVALRVENINGNTAVNTLKTRGFSCSRIGTSSAQPDSVTILDGDGLLKNSPGELVSVIINEVGVAGATLELFDNIAAVGVPIISLDLTNDQIPIPYGRRLNNGLFYDTSGAGFEVVVNWR